MEKVTVIIPTYNRAHLIAETIHSVLDQTYRNFEIIVIDDGSTDNTSEIIKSLGHGNRIKYIYKEHCGIPGRMRNIGIANSAGSLIAFLDSDDSWLPHKLEAQVRYLTNHPEADVVYSDFYFYRSSANQCHNEECISTVDCQSGNIWKNLFMHCFIPTLTVILRRKCLNSNSPFHEGTETIGTEDYDLWLRLAVANCFAFIPAKLAKYRISPEGIGKTSVKHITNILNVIRRFDEGYPRLTGSIRIRRRRRFGSLYCMLAIQYLRENEAALAGCFARKAFRMWPLQSKTAALFTAGLFGSSALRSLSRFHDRRLGDLGQDCQ